MCGRFTVTTKDTKKVADRFQVELEKALERNAAGNAPPPSKERAKKVLRHPPFEISLALAMRASLAWRNAETRPPNQEFH